MHEVKMETWLLNIITPTCPIAAAAAAQIWQHQSDGTKNLKKMVRSHVQKRACKKQSLFSQSQSGVFDDQRVELSQLLVFLALGVETQRGQADSFN